jgi:S1-C subfamily serine protease
MSKSRHIARRLTIPDLLALFLMGLLLSSSARAAQTLPEAIARIKPSIVGIGTFQKTRSPATVFNGTGFVVGDGRHAVTNAHVVARDLDTERLEGLIVLVGSGEGAEGRQARIVAVDRARDLALLRFEGDAVPALIVGDSADLREGQELAFTGFPIGMALGLYPATHKATLAAIVPVARPGITAKQLNPRMISRLRDSAYGVLQLDATAFPGNSGSPLYDAATGRVYGIVNSVFVQGTREQAISRPSGITYAIPSAHILELMQQAKVSQSQ